MVTDPEVGVSVTNRVMDLVGMNRDSWHERARLRDVMNGGPAAVARLLGNKFDPDAGLPVANLMLSANERLAQKLGRVPDIKVDTPSTQDSDRAREQAERRERIVASYDRSAKLPLLMPQLGRWIPGYGMAAAVIRQGRDHNDQPYPKIELRDPYETMPGPFGVDQQPADIAFVRLVARNELARQYPRFAEVIRNPASTAMAARHGRTPGALGVGRWSLQGDGDHVEVYEYMNIEGVWWVLPEAAQVLSFVRNPLRGRTQFYVGKRFSFDRIQGQYEHALGLMASLARLNLLTIIAAEDAVFSETNVSGDVLSGNYERGRDAVNILTQGTQVQRANTQIPFQVFQNADRIERQLRIISAYPVTDDAQSPNSFVTGRGLDELTAGVDRAVREYFTVLGDLLMEMDSRRLEWDERLYGDSEKVIEGHQSGAAFSEKYRPKAHINGRWSTRRVFGAMAGFDDPTKIITGLQLLQGDIIDADTMREQIDGLENHAKIRDRIRAEKAERVAFDTIMALAGQGDVRAMATAIKLLPAGDMRSVFEEFFQTEEPQIAEAEAQLQPPAPAGAPPDTTTVLSRLMGGDGGGAESTGGIQTVGRL